LHVECLKQLSVLPDSAVHDPFPAWYGTSDDIHTEPEYLCDNCATAAALSPNADDASTTGWNSSSDQYTFACISDVDAVAGNNAQQTNSQLSASTQPLKLLLKALVLGDSLLTTLASDSATAEPAVLELLLDDFTVGSSEGNAAGTGGVAKTYKNLDQLAGRVPPPSHN